MLLTVQIHEREEKLGVYIRALASEMLSEDEIKTYAHCFKDIYSSDFRHSYAKFFPIITEIGEDKTLSLDFLSNNLEEAPLM